MELLCVCCGKPWDVAHVLREATTEFDLEGALIRGCPSCQGVEPDGMTEEKRDALRVAATAARFLGDDVDGLIALDEEIKALK